MKRLFIKDEPCHIEDVAQVLKVAIGGYFEIRIEPFASDNNSEGGSTPVIRLYERDRKFGKSDITPCLTFIISPDEREIRDELRLLSR